MEWGRGGDREREGKGGEGLDCGGGVGMGREGKEEGRRGTWLITEGVGGVVARIGCLSSIVTFLVW